VSLGVGQLIRGFVFGVTFYDPPTIAAVVVTIAAVTGFAALLPARRATRLDPTVALRSE
jgi:putative ABC transport system permease protein